MKNLTKALFDAKKEIGKISKDSTNPFFNSKYFDVNALLEHVEPILMKHNILVIQPIENDCVCTILIHVDSGEQQKSSIKLSENKDPQKLGSEITYFRRYTLQSVLSLQAEDDDANKASGNNKGIEKPTPEIWLNHKDKQGNLTKEWQNIVLALSEGKITSLHQVREHYKVSKIVAEELTKIGLK
jgi:hypothetical protein